MKQKLKHTAMTVSALLFGMSIYGCMAADPEWEAANPKLETSGGAVSVERGQKVFEVHCVQCHGKSGEGDGSMSYSWRDGQYIPNLADAAFIKARSKEIPVSIREGRNVLPAPFVVMPQFKYILSNEDVSSVIKYINTLD